MKFAEVELRSPHMASLHVHISRSAGNTTEFRLPATNTARVKPSASTAMKSSAATKAGASA